MKIFLSEICCLLLSVCYSKKWKKNVLLCVYKRFDVMCINVFNVMYKLRLVGLNIYFYDVFFSYKMGSKWVQKRV